MTPQPIRWIRLMLVIILLLLSATACGQRGKLYHPEDGQASLSGAENHA